MKRLMIFTVLLPVLTLSSLTGTKAQTGKTRKMQDTMQRTPADKTRKNRPLNKGMDSVTLYPNDSIPGKNIQGR